LELYSCYKNLFWSHHHI